LATMYKVVMDLSTYYTIVCNENRTQKYLTKNASKMDSDFALVVRVSNSTNQPIIGAVVQNVNIRSTTLQADGLIIAFFLVSIGYQS